MKVIVDKEKFEKELRIILDELFFPEFSGRDDESIHYENVLRSKIMDVFNFYSEDINE